MYKCMECGCEFEEPRTIRESHGLEYGWEEINVCPNCGEGGYEIGKPCETCDDNYAYGGCFCDNCRAEAKRMLKVDFEHFTSRHMEDLIDLFNESLDELYVEERRKK